MVSGVLNHMAVTDKSNYVHLSRGEGRIKRGDLLTIQTMESIESRSEEICNGDSSAFMCEGKAGNNNKQDTEVALMEMMGSFELG